MERREEEERSHNFSLMSIWAAGQRTHRVQPYSFAKQISLYLFSRGEGLRRPRVFILPLNALRGSIGSFALRFHRPQICAFQFGNDRIAGHMTHDAEVSKALVYERELGDEQANIGWHLFCFRRCERSHMDRVPLEFYWRANEACVGYNNEDSRELMYTLALKIRNSSIRTWCFSNKGCQ